MLKYLILAATVCTALSENSYVVMTTKVIRPGLPVIVSITILKSTLPVVVTAKLLNTLNNQTVATASGSFNEGEPGTIQLNIPADLPAGGYKLRVEGLGDGQIFTNESYLIYDNHSFSSFIQMDKRMYKPGEKFRFRAVGMYSNMKVIVEPVDVDIYDSNMYKIKQWRGVQGVSGVITRDFVLDTNAVLGDYTIVFMYHGSKSKMTFKVDRYVRPPFRVKVKLPSYLIYNDATLTGNITAMYPYNQPVKGTVEITAIKLNGGYANPLQGSTVYSTTLEIYGEVDFSIPLRNNSRIENARSIIVEARVTEKVSGVSQNGSSEIGFFLYPLEIKMIAPVPTVFRTGFPYIAYARVSQIGGEPLSEMNISRFCSYSSDDQWCVPQPYTVTIQMSVTSDCESSADCYSFDLWVGPATREYDLPPLEYSVPDCGIVEITLDIPSNATAVTLNIEDGSKLLEHKYYIFKTYSPSESYIQLLSEPTNMKAGQKAVFEVQGMEGIPSAIYQVISRGSIVSVGTFTGNQLSFMTTEEMAPRAHVVVYYVRADGEIVTDRFRVDIEDPFVNKVSVSFNETHTEPGRESTVYVDADPQSHIYLLAVDQSGSELKCNNKLSPYTIVRELGTYDTATYERSDIVGAQQIFDQVGLAVMTDAKVYRREYPEYILPWLNGLADSEGEDYCPDVSSPPTDAWLWSDDSIGTSGRLTITATAPDKMTSWTAYAFAVHPQTGLGMAPITETIEIFRPLFVTVALPYSVIRGEECPLDLQVFSYMMDCVNVTLTLELSDDFNIIGIDDLGVLRIETQPQSAQLGLSPDETAAAKFMIVPTSLGYIDIIVKLHATVFSEVVTWPLLVEPEGEPKLISRQVLVDLRDTALFSETVPLSVPNNVVAGSQRIVVTATGDLIGPAVNADQILFFPSEFCEQIMTDLAKHVFMVNYLSGRGQLTTAVKEEALSYISLGYHRLLEYRRDDGSISYWGQADQAGNMWLTAFAVKTLYHAKTQLLTEVDETLMSAIDWILINQNMDGSFSFPELGEVNHQIQGGTNSNPGFTAFVLIALLESSNIKNETLQQKISTAAFNAKPYLDGQLTTVTDSYVLSIISYAFTLAKWPVKDVLNKLNARAIVQDNIKHWESTRPRSFDTVWQLEVEATAYALLSLTGLDDISGALPVMKWLAQKSFDDFDIFNLQDMVICLESLGEFATKVHTDDLHVGIDIVVTDHTITFNIDLQNKDLLQSTVVPTIADAVMLNATGHGMVLVNVELSFHVDEGIE